MRGVTVRKKRKEPPHCKWFVFKVLVLKLRVNILSWLFCPAPHLWAGPQQSPRVRLHTGLKQLPEMDSGALNSFQFKITGLVERKGRVHFCFLTGGLLQGVHGPSILPLQIPKLWGVCVYLCACVPVYKQRERKKNRNDMRINLNHVFT